jgi:hypothetical protein
MATSSSSPLKEAYRTFNRAVKKFLHHCRDTFPELESPVKSGLVLLKITKSVSIKFAFKIYMDLFDAPYRAYLDAKDTDFFISDAFSVQYIEDYVSKFKCCFSNCAEPERKAIWQAAQGIFDARDTVVKLKEGSAVGSDVDSEV